MKTKEQWVEELELTRLADNGCHYIKSQDLEDILFQLNYSSDTKSTEELANIAFDGLARFEERSEWGEYVIRFAKNEEPHEEQVEEEFNFKKSLEKLVEEKQNVDMLDNIRDYIVLNGFSNVEDGNKYIFDGCSCIDIEIFISELHKTVSVEYNWRNDDGCWSTSRYYAASISFLKGEEEIKKMLVLVFNEVLENVSKLNTIA